MLGSPEEARLRLVAARLYVISAPGEARAQADTLCAAIDGGADVVQLRNKTAAPADLLEEARRVASHARSRRALFIVNDHPDLAAAAHADGVHLGQDDGDLEAARARLQPGALVGRSTHGLAQAQAAEEQGADYIGVGPVHETPTKPGRPAIGLATVREVARSVSLPWFAIGGLDAGNLAEVLAAGATRVAVVRAVAAAPDPREAAAGLLAALGGTAVGG